jgi:hypothetical protein
MPADPDRADGAEQAARGTGRALARRDFEQVIRRAAELSLSDTDPDDVLTEAEVVRIATELGLPAHHVQQALFELPELTVRPKWYDRYFGTPVFSVARAVPTRKAPALRRVEDYLVTREYLQIVRKRSDTIAFVPADDTISSLARALARPGSRHTISRASRVMVGIHELPDDAAHVRFEVDLSGARKDLVQTGSIVGGGLGLAFGSLAVMLTAATLPEALGPIPHVLAFGGTAAATMAASISVAARSFKSRVFAAKMELTGLLDRLERGDRLDPPPAPWRRKLQLRLFGDRSG